MSSPIKLTSVIVGLIVLLMASNGYWLLSIKNMKIEQHQERLKQAEDFITKLEYQRELTNSSIETVTQETNLYLQLNQQLQEENNVLQNELDKLLKDDECANSRIPDNVRRRLFTQN